MSTISKVSDKVVLGLSGGRDSVYLFHWLLDRGYTIIPVHVNHNIRKEEAKRDEQFCRKLCEKYGLRCMVFNVDIPKEQQEFGGSLETIAASRRRNILLQVSKANDLCPIALAHHQDDNAETVLFRLCRGSGGLKGMKVNSVYAGVRIFRPLLNMSRHDITMACKRNGWEWVEDSTNQVNDVARNIIRNKVFPDLKEALTHPVVKNFCQSVEIQERNNTALNEALELLPLLDPQGRLYLPYLQDKSDEFCAAVIKWFLDKHNCPHITAQKINDLVDIVKYRTDKTSIAFTMGYICKRKEKRLFFIH